MKCFFPQKEAELTLTPSFGAPKQVGAIEGYSTSLFAANTCATKRVPLTFMLAEHNCRFGFCDASALLGTTTLTPTKNNLIPTKNQPNSLSFNFVLSLSLHCNCSTRLGQARLSLCGTIVSKGPKVEV